MANATNQQNESAVFFSYREQLGGTYGVLIRDKIRLCIRVNTLYDALVYFEDVEAPGVKLSMDDDKRYVELVTLGGSTIQKVPHFSDMCPIVWSANYRVVCGDKYVMIKSQRRHVITKHASTREHNDKDEKESCVCGCACVKCSKEQFWNPKAEDAGDTWTRILKYGPERDTDSMTIKISKNTAIHIQADSISHGFATLTDAEDTSSMFSMGDWPLVIVDEAGGSVHKVEQQFELHSIAWDTDYRVDCGEYGFITITNPRRQLVSKPQYATLMMTIAPPKSQK